MFLVLIEAQPIDKLWLQLNANTKFMNEGLKENNKD